MGYFSMEASYFCRRWKISFCVIINLIKNYTSADGLIAYSKKVRSFSIVFFLELLIWTRVPLRLVGLAVVVGLAGWAVFGDSANEVVEVCCLIWGWLLWLDWGWGWRLRNVLGWSLDDGSFGWFGALWVVNIEDKLVKLRRMFTCKTRPFFETQILYDIFVLPDLILHLFADLLLLLILLRTILHILQLHYITSFVPV